MAEVTFLTLENVLELHEMQIERYGGATGIRDQGCLSLLLLSHKLHLADSMFTKVSMKWLRRMLFTSQKINHLLTATNGPH